MLLLLLLASAFLLVPWAGAGRIIGGSEAKPHSWPYMAYLSIRNELDDNIRCGGFLIRPDAVLSAAHCVAEETKVNITWTLGAHNVNRKELSQQAFSVGQWLIHPNYSGDTLANDIMLLKMELKVQHEELCEMPFKHCRPAPMICAGDENGKKTAFHGDSGGPLVCNGKVHSIVSYDTQHCIFPGVFTRVSYFEPWTFEELRKFRIIE
ncbi:LOW QUALITY PROTEIN: duodenase-1-like [Alca torda]